MRALFPLLLLFALPFLHACDDDVIDALPSRYVYFADGSGSLQRYDITLKKIENLQTTGVTHITPVAQNGIVLFETEPGADATLWGFCQDGSIIPVPMPVAASSAEEYSYGRAAATLGADGHHAAWAVYRRPKGSVDTLLWTQELCRFDCQAWKMQQIDVTTFVRAQFVGGNFQPDIVDVRDMLISKDGQRVVASVELTDLKLDGSREHQSLLLLWEGTQLSLLQGTKEQMHILSFDRECVTLFYESAKRYYAYDCIGRTVISKQFVTDRPEMLRPAAFAAATGEYVASFTGGEILALIRLSDAGKTSVLPSIRDLTAYFPEIIYGELRPWASVSPDGEWVAFCWKVDAAEHLFVVRRNGEDLRRIAQGSFRVPVSVSDEIPL
jgi:hypothetical protein